MVNERKRDNDKTLFAFLGIAILLFSVVSVSFAVFSITRESEENIIKTGSITISYIETNNVIDTKDALPTLDATGKESSQYFEFTVSTTANGVDVPYEINLKPSNDDVSEALKDEQIKVYLTKYESENPSETVLVKETLISKLDKSEVQNRSDCYVIYSTTDNHTDKALGSATTTTYRLRMWIDNEVVFSLPSADGSLGEGEVDASKEHTYKLKVNVDSTVKPIGTKE